MKNMIGVVAQQRCVYSQTYIRAHIELLPATVRELYIQELPLDRGEVVKNFMIDNKIEAVLAEFGSTGVDIMDACESTSVPLVVRFAGRDAYQQQPPSDPLYHRLFDKASAIVAVSHAMRRRLVQMGAPEGKVYCCPSGANTSLFSGANPLLAPPIFVAVGRFVDKKAPHLTLMAFNNVLKTCCEAKLVMLGTGHLLEACRQIARALRIERAVDFRGPCPHEEVAAVLRRARCFVQHSIATSNGDSEGTPNSVMEAGAAGLPVIATRHGGIPEVVIDGQTGLLVEEGDIAGMADRMTQLAMDGHMAAELGKRAQARVRRKFSMEKSITHLWAIIQKVITNNSVL